MGILQFRKPRVIAVTDDGPSETLYTKYSYTSTVKLTYTVDNEVRHYPFNNFSQNIHMKNPIQIQILWPRIQSHHIKISLINTIKQLRRVLRLHTPLLPNLIICNISLAQNMEFLLSVFEHLCPDFSFHAVLHDHGRFMGEPLIELNNQILCKAASISCASEVFHLVVGIKRSSVSVASLQPMKG